MDGGTWAVIVAAGRGSRFGRPKQFERLGERSVLQWSIDTARSVVDGVVVVLPGEFVNATTLLSGVDRIAVGGASRADSVRAGLSCVPTDAEIIVVHDAARPLASPALFSAVIAAVRGGADGAVPGIPITDTLKRVEGATIVETLDRDALVAVQTPQAFRAASLRKGHAGGTDATDDAAMVEAFGGTVVVVPGEPRNLKLTDPHDLEFAVRLVDKTPTALA